MGQVVFQLIDLDSEFLVIVPVNLNLLIVGFQVLLLLGHLAFVPLSLLFELNTGLSELSPHLFHVLGVHREAAGDGLRPHGLLLDALNLALYIRLQLHESAFLSLYELLVVGELQLDVAGLLSNI